MAWWPFGGNDQSAASFEKILSHLSTKIQSESAKNDKFRLRQRKYKVLWTIYAVFTYILIAAIFVLVYGWDRWGVVEYTVVAGGPPFIFGVRTALDSYYAWRLQASQDHLNELFKQREANIEKLKSATKYDSTQQLLDKYGGSPKGKQQQQPSPQSKGKQGNKKSGVDSNRQSWPQGGRTNIAPPPTANIPSKQPPAAPAREASRPPNAQARPVSMIAAPSAPSEEFAPNAFEKPRRPPMPTHPSQYATAERKWYDRVLDVMLGEDEGQNKNRIALICENCRLVNGQAPPGARTLEDIGRWRCGSCHAWNGVESEERKILKHITGSDVVPESPTGSTSGADLGLRSRSPTEHDTKYEHLEEDIDEEDDEDEDGEAKPVAVRRADSEDAPADSTRSKTRQRKKV